MATRYYFLDPSNQPQGPVETAALRKLRDAEQLNGDSLVAAEGASEWVALKTIIPCLAKPVAPPQYAGVPGAPLAEQPFPTGPARPPAPAYSGDSPAGKCGSLFYWIAALSVANALSALAGGNFYFFFGLGITLLIGEIGHSIGPIGIGIALIVNLMISAGFAVFGYFGNRYHLWPFIVGGFFYVLDGLIFLLAQEWLGLLFHVGIFIFLVKNALATRGLAAE